MEPEGVNITNFSNLTYATASNIQAPTNFEDTNAFNNSYQYLNDGTGRWAGGGRRIPDYQNPYEWSSRSSTTGPNQNQLTAMSRTGEGLSMPTMNFSSNNYHQKAPKNENQLNTGMSPANLPWNTLDGTLNTPLLKEDYSRSNMYAGNSNYSEEVDINYNKTYNRNKAGMPWNTLDGTNKTPLVPYQNPNTTTCQFNYGEKSILSNPENANNININQKNLRLNISSSVSDFWNESGGGINATLLLQHDEQQLNTDKHQHTMSMQQLTACVEAKIPNSVMQNCMLPERPIARPNVWEEDEKKPSYFSCKFQYQQSTASLQSSMNKQNLQQNISTSEKWLALNQQPQPQSVWDGSVQPNTSYPKTALNPIAWENTNHQPKQEDFFPSPFTLQRREDNIQPHMYIPQTDYRNVATPAPSRRRGSNRRQFTREEAPSPWAQPPPPPYSSEPSRFLRETPSPWENTQPSIPVTRSSTRERRGSLRPKRGQTPAPWGDQSQTKPLATSQSGRGRGSRGSRGVSRSTRQTELSYKTNPVERRTYSETPFPNRNEELNKLLRGQDRQHTNSSERQLRSSSKREQNQTATVHGRVAAAQSCRVQPKQTQSENLMTPGILTRSKRRKITTESLNLKAEKNDPLQFWSPNGSFVDVEIPDVEPLPQLSSEDISEYMENL